MALLWRQIRTAESNLLWEPVQEYAGALVVLGATGGSGTLSASCSVSPVVEAALQGGAATLSALVFVSPLIALAATGGSGTLSAESTVADGGGVTSAWAGVGGSGVMSAAAQVSPLSAAALEGGSGSLSAASSAQITFVMPATRNLVRERAELRIIREPAEVRFIPR